MALICHCGLDCDFLGICSALALLYRGSRLSLIHIYSMWLEKECTESLTVKEFRETGNRIIVMQDRIRQLIVNEKQQKEDLMFQVSAASHDLKTPLTIIRGNVEFLQTITENDQSQECLADVYKRQRIMSSV